MLVLAVESRRLISPVLETAALPVMALTAYFTLSRGGAIEIAVALAVLLALHPRRLELLPTLVLGSGGAALAIAAATRRSALEDNLQNASAAKQGGRDAGSGADRLRGRGPPAGGPRARPARALARPRISRRAAAQLAGGLLTAALALGLASGLPDRLSNAWHDFKAPQSSSSGAEHFSSASGNGRYQYWSSALDANAMNPLIGIGPGTFDAGEGCAHLLNVVRV